MDDINNNKKETWGIPYVLQADLHYTLNTQTVEKRDSKPRLKFKQYF